MKRRGMDFFHMKGALCAPYLATFILNRVILGASEYSAGIIK
jgi:hypothetical protein